MKLTSLSKASLALGCCATAVSISGCKEKHPVNPNIIIVLADDQGWGDVAYNGHPVLKTPNFDAMASSGLRFDRFYAAAPISSPTRGSLMTGRHPNRFGCFMWGNNLRPQETTIAEALKEAGYVTGHFGKWHLGSIYKGSPVNPGGSGFDEWFSAINFFENNPILSGEGIAKQFYGESSMVTVDLALEFIKKHSNTSQPVFAFVCFGSPHLPHIAAEEDRILYLDQEEEFQHFYGEITGMDRAVGKLRQQLKEMGIDKNTILWFLSDNGGLPNFGSTGGRGAKESIYEGGLRVPAIIEWPAQIKKPLVSNIPCTTSDIYPTLLEIAGVKIRNQPVLDGISLVPLFKNKMKNRKEPIGFWSYPETGVRTPTRIIMPELLENQKAGIKVIDPSSLLLDAGEITKQYPSDLFPGHSAWLKWPFKLHRIQQKSGEITLELYNLGEDPMEEKDLAESDETRVNTMKTQLEEWLLSVVGSLNGNDYR